VIDIDEEITDEGLDEADDKLVDKVSCNNFEDGDDKVLEGNKK
jgi:hypothetical protein